LNACRYDVEKLWNVRKEALHTPSEQLIDNSQQSLNVERQRLLTKLNSVIAQLQKLVDNPHYGCIVRDLTNTIDALHEYVPTIERAEDSAILTQILQDMRQQERTLLSALEQAVEPEIRDALLARAEQQLTSYKPNMKTTVYEQTRRIAFLKILRDTYPFPSFL
jgi:hypothetical protein